MRLLLTVGTMLLCACATGVVDPIDISEPETLENIVPPPKAPPPISSSSNCEVRSYWSGNCLVKKTYCNNQLKKIDVMCDRGRELFPWEYIPDPPFDGER